MRPHTLNTHAGAALLAAASLAALLVGAGLGALPARQALAADKASGQASEKTGYTWSANLDCTLCHATQATSLEAAANDEKATGAGSAKAEGDSSDVQAGKTASTSAGDTDAGEQDGDKDGDKNGEPADAPANGLDAWASMHAQTFGLSCLACHEDSEQLATAHKNLNSGRNAIRLKKTDVPNGVCLTCHNQATLAEATEKSTVLTDTEGTAANPHALPGNDEHASIGCTDCHTAHDEDATLAQTALATCTKCHHANVFACGTCHE